MMCDEVGADIGRRASRIGVEVQAYFLGGLEITRLCVGCGEGFEEAAVGSRYFVVDFTR